MSICAECGAGFAAGSNCRANLDGLLFLEAEVPGGPGERAHFLAVITYALQHPGSMRYTAETYRGAQLAVKRVLEGAATIADIRRSVRGQFEGARPVLRRDQDPAPEAARRDWRLNVAYVLAARPDQYAERVESWARATIEELAAAYAGSWES